jgi:ribosomal protein S18 acetylase RimI-like enzyme
MAALQELVARLWKRLYYREDRYLYLAPDPETLAGVVADQQYQMVRVDASNADVIDTWEGIKESFRQEFREMLAAGEVGLFFLDGNAVASHVWLQINRGSGVIHRGYLRVYPGEAYSHFAHTYPAYRRQNLAHLLASQLIQMQETLAAEGVHALKASVLVSNTPSLALLRSVGAHIVGRTTQWRILGFDFYRVRLNEIGKAHTEVRW